jgi:hypothetical protein
MNTIKNQVDELIQFTATNLDELSEQKSALIDRLSEGVDRMKEAKVFTEAEIKEISQYGVQVLNARFAAAKQEIANTIRKNFKF